VGHSKITEEMCLHCQTTDGPGKKHLYSALRILPSVSPVTHRLSVSSIPCECPLYCELQVCC